MEIVRATPGDWVAMRDIRLEMLADTPLAYLETLESARTRTDDQWRERARQHTLPGSLVLGAVPGWTGEAPRPWVGTMSGYRRPDGVPCLAAVYVAPAHRGTDLPRRLLADVVAWARDDVGADRLLLEVHEHNPRARRFYERAGFVLTGGWTPYRLDPSTRDLEMALALPR
ncbi:GNAT family N-acetyltransferase [Luteimicrobium sp. NPDC057192]|uniref:GNAT family N-acetyltransferase n=1 Tax=Luteimicrobium sp. NPDC057192 TaxID=3346042 RepID=UPI00362A3558